MHDNIRPGVYADLPNADYHGGPGTSKSGFDLLHRSAELFDFVKHSEDGHESTDAQAFGTAYHTIILEPELFARSYCLALRPQDVPDAIDDRDTLVAMVQKLNAGRLPKLATTGDKATLVDRIVAARDEQRVPNAAEDRAILFNMKGAELKTEIESLNAYRAGLLPVSGTRHELADLLRANGVSIKLWSDVQAEWTANNGDKIILSESDWNTLHAMRDRLMRHPAASALLRKKGRAEMSFYWVDKETGELLRCRPDYLTDCGIIVDLKTARDASPTGFVSSVQSYRYDVQVPFYIDGVSATIRQTDSDRTPPRAFVFVAQEKTPPYQVGVYTLDPEDVELGRAEYRADLRKLAECRRTDSWPGYGDGIQQISLKAWHRQETALAVTAASPTIH